ncbi:MAG: adenosylcobinamide-GDP ribazoletransferase [Massilibacteroides sp.]|nr:adenosylcobinamide-GDP ribazoletransferase [Massilibacteroides sp.]
MKQIAAAFIFFTRLPIWRLKVFNVTSDYFKDAINYWTLTGWLTAGVMSGVLWLAAQIFPYAIAVVLALISRILLTGALHEDGLADFLDGFGGGRGKESILTIMKDSHIGTYGVLGLIFYLLLFFLLLSHLPQHIAYLMIMIADPLCKLISSQIVRFLPYARTVEGSKSKIIYRKATHQSLFISCLFGLLPLLMIPNVKWLAALFFPFFTFFLLIRLMKKKINGYTGDCCGAMFLLSELSFYIGVYVCLKLFPL